MPEDPPQGPPGNFRGTPDSVPARDGFPDSEAKVSSKEPPQFGQAKCAERPNNINYSKSQIILNVFYI